MNIYQFIIALLRFGATFFGDILDAEERDVTMAVIGSEADPEPWEGIFADKSKCDIISVKSRSLIPHLSLPPVYQHIHHHSSLPNFTLPFLSAS